FPIQRRAPWLGFLLTQLGVVLCFVPFRAATFARTGEIWRAMMGLGVPFGEPRAWRLLAAAAVAFFAVHVAERLVTGTASRGDRAVGAWLRVPAPLRGVVTALAFVSCVVLLVDGTTFIYFRF